jgi:3-hydroxyacyl-CoA dehydrogenase, NAD binding domain
MPDEQPVSAGVVGLGLMGTSIATCLLAAGHRVVAIDKDATRRRNLKRRVSALLRDMRREKLSAKDPASVMKNLSTSDDFGALRDCGLVIESIFENLNEKRDVLRKIEDAVPPETLIGSNTSALPVTELQRGARHPERILGIHWGEPAHILRFLEVICGAETDQRNAEKVMRLASRWRKEPTLVRRDVRGFITNRIMYAKLLHDFANGIFCGNSDWGWPTAKAYLDRAEQSPSTAVFSLLGHGTLRIARVENHLGPLSERDLDWMEHKLSESIEQGACGFSTGLMYSPGASAPFGELERLCRVVARQGKTYATHMRDYGDHLAEAVDEQLQLARKTGCRLQISHLQAVGPRNWDKQQAALDKIATAAADGIDVGFDCYPYTRGSTVLTQLLPQWAGGRH